MARRWIEFCREQRIEATVASSLLARARGHYKTAMRMWEAEGAGR